MAKTATTPQNATTPQKRPADARARFDAGARAKTATTPQKRPADARARLGAGARPGRTKRPAGAGARFGAGARARLARRPAGAGARFGAGAQARVAQRPAGARAPQEEYTSLRKVLVNRLRRAAQEQKPETALLREAIAEVDHAPNRKMGLALLHAYLGPVHPGRGRFARPAVQDVIPQRTKKHPMGYGLHFFPSDFFSIGEGSAGG